MKNYPKFPMKRDFSQFQDLFTKAMHGLAAQGWKQSRNLTCMYRGDDNRKCFVGHLIPDEEYNFKFEHNAFRSIFGEIPSFLKRRDEEGFDVFMASGQLVHDQHSLPSGMQEDYQYMAATSNLIFPKELE